MRSIFLVLVFFIHSLVTIAQTQNCYLVKGIADDSQCKEAKIWLVQYAINTGDSLVESGIIVNERRIETSVFVENGLYVFGFGNQSTRVPRMSFECAENQRGKTFNGKYEGRKVGIWFKQYPWGDVRKAIMYKAGLVERVIYFRPTGKIRLVSNYKNGKKSKGGDYQYDKQGLLTNGMVPF